MNKGFSFKKLNKSFLITTLFIVGIAFFIPNYVIGAKKVELNAKPTAKDIRLSWETNTAKIEEFIITRTTAEETKLFYVKGDKNSYIDSQVEPRTAYSYKVTAKRKGKIIEESNVLENVILSKADNPHGMYSNATSLCNTCHANKEFIEGESASMAQAKLCFSCHGDMEKHMDDVKISGSTHPVMSKDIELKCTDCHDPHKMAEEENPSILNLTFKLKDDSILKLNEVNADFCFACHNDGGKSSIVIDKELYNQGPHSAKNNTSEIEPSTKISCNNCHTSHASEFKSLLKFQFDPFSKKTDVKNNQLCFSCHGQESKTNILKLYNGNEDGVNKGHYIKDKELAKSLDLPVGWKLSCADCHDTHGTRNDKAISDKLGEFKSISDPVKKERAICTSCHAYSNDSINKSIFRGIFFAALPDTVEQHSINPNVSIKSCTSCHGDNNPVFGAHAPKSGLKPPKKAGESKDPTSEEDKKVEPVKEKPATDSDSNPPKGSDTGGDTTTEPNKDNTTEENTEPENNSDTANSVPKATY